jgi:hypothetical protein
MKLLLIPLLISFLIIAMRVVLAIILGLFISICGFLLQEDILWSTGIIMDWIGILKD